VGRRRAARALLPALTLGYPAELGALGPDGHPLQRAGISAARPCRASTTSACRSSVASPRPPCAVGAVADHVVRTLRRRLDAPGGGCCGARRRRLPRANRSSNVRTASWLTDWANPHPTAHGDGRMTRSGAGAAVGPPSRPEPLSGHPQSDRRVGCAASPAAVQGVRRTRSQDLTMRRLLVRARRLEANFCPLYVVEASPAAPLELLTVSAGASRRPACVEFSGSSAPRFAVAAPAETGTPKHCRDGLSGGWSSCWLSPARSSEQLSGPPVARRIESARRTALGHGRRPVRSRPANCGWCPLMAPWS
jgi:hypothetical protein